MLVVVMEQEGSGPIAGSCHEADPGQFEIIRSTLGPRAYPHGPLPMRQIVDFFMQGRTALRVRSLITPDNTPSHRSAAASLGWPRVHLCCCDTSSHSTCCADGHDRAHACWPGQLNDTSCMDTTVPPAVLHFIA